MQSALGFSVCGMRPNVSLLARFTHPSIFAFNTERHESDFIFRLPQHCLVANTSSVLKTG